MNLAKFSIIVLLITLLASLYVHQQIRIVQLAYQEQEKLACLKGLIEENKRLNYNLNCRTSLISIAGLWKDGDFEWPQREQLVSLQTMQKIDEGSHEIIKKEGMLARFFRIRSQAEATPVKPR
ncbi:MAG: hypothetical protein ABH914_03940 [Candidatus Omnitrophota bacterium]